MDTLVGALWLYFGSIVIFGVALRNRDLANVLIVAFLVRTGLALLDNLVIRLPGQSDSMHFDYFAYYWARDGLAGTLNYISTGARLYTWLCAAFYAVFERSRLMMQALNVLFGTLIVFNVARLVQVLGGSARRMRQAAWVTALFPSLVYFSSVMLREIAVAYPLSLGVLFLARWYHERRLVQFLAGGLAIVTSMAFHSGSVAVLLVAVLWLVLRWLRSAFVPGARNFLRNTITLLGGLAVAAFVSYYDFGLGKFSHVREGGTDSLTRAQDAFSKGRTGYLKDLHPESPAEVVLQAPLRLVYFLFAPFPWMVRAPADVVGLVDAMLFFGLLVQTWRQRRLLMARGDALLVITGFVAMALVFAVGVSNYGTAHRHRSKMLPLLISVGFAVSTERRHAAQKEKKLSGQLRRPAERFTG